MANYFFGLAANPFTKAHHKVITDILKDDPKGKVFIGLTDHDYKHIDMPWSARNEVLEAELKDLIDAGKVEIYRQNKRSYEFLSNIWDHIDYVVVGQDEWDDLKAGKWHHSQELLDGWKWKVFPREDGVSSTKVRELLRKGADYDEMKDLISEQVYEMAKSYFNKERTVICG